MNKLGERLKALRKQKNMPQIIVGKAIGTTSQTISAYERNRREPDLKTLKKLADFFNVSTDYLLGRVEIKNYNVNIENDNLYLIYNILIESELINENDNIEIIQKNIKYLKDYKVKVDELCAIVMKKDK